MSANALFAEWLRGAREAAGFPQQALADCLGVHQSTVSKIEAGKTPVTLDQAEAVARIFGADLSDVLAGLPPRETGTELARARNLLLHIYTATRAEIEQVQR